MADNGLRFQIRHGNGNPVNNLKQYELGYDYTNKKFYIGTGTSTSPSSEEIKYLHLTGGILSGKLTIETTTSDAKAYCKVKDKETDAYIQMGIQTSKERIGICTNGYYDASKNFVSTSINWMIYRDTDGKNIFKGKADSAGTADSATKDGAGDTITSTYLKITNASSTYLTKTSAENTYLKLSGGVLTGSLALGTHQTTSAVILRCNRVVSNTLYRLQIHVTSGGYAGFYLYNPTGATTGNNGDNGDAIGYFTFNGTGAYFKGNTILNSSNYSNYALPLSGGTLTGSLKFSSGAKYIYHTYNDTEYDILRSANTANVSINAKGGYLYLGYYHTTRIYLSPKGENSTAPIVIIGPGTYGTSLPDSGVTGQIFFKLES